MAFLEAQYKSDENDFTKDMWFTDKGPLGVSGFNLNGKEIGDYCSLCKASFSCTRELLAHFDGKRHGSKHRNLRTENSCLVIESSTGKADDPDNLFLPDCCKVCGVDLISPDQAESHYMSDRHQKKVRTFFLVKVGAKKASAKKQPENDKSETEKVKSDIEYCGICKVDFSSKIVADSHYKGKKHAKKLREEFIEVTHDKTVWRRCTICDIRVNSSQQLDLHLRSAKHRSMEQKRRILMSGKKDIIEENTNCVVEDTLEIKSLADQKTDEKNQANAEPKQIQGEKEEKNDPGTSGVDQNDEAETDLHNLAMLENSSCTETLDDKTDFEQSLANNEENSADVTSTEPAIKGDKVGTKSTESDENVVCHASIGDERRQFEKRKGEESHENAKKIKAEEDTKMMET